jgi:UDP-2,3-diacylglucosamine pyrophosphatase LpxH
MANKKTLFVSDIHLGGGEKWVWFSAEKEGPFLRKFFHYVAARQAEKADIKELVLLGDVFDLWVCPHDVEPHTFSQILKTHKEVIREIKTTAKTVPILYVNGNHDFRVSKDHIREAFGGCVEHIGTHYRRRNIYAEHGHKFALFNRPDPKNGGPEGLPLGYYISRLHTSLGHTRKGKFNLAVQAIDELFQMLGPEKMPEAVLDSMRGAVENTTGTSVSGFNMGPGRNDRSYEYIKDSYKNLYEDWYQSKGYWYASQMILCELNRLGTIADSLCRDGINIVILGHSHDTKMDKDSWFTEDRIYANCGYWCGFGEQEKIEDNAHFVETDGTRVELVQFRDGRAKRANMMKL